MTSKERERTYTFVIYEGSLVELCLVPVCVMAHNSFIMSTLYMRELHIKQQSIIGILALDFLPIEIQIYEKI